MEGTVVTSRPKMTTSRSRSDGEGGERRDVEQRNDGADERVDPNCRQPRVQRQPRSRREQWIDQTSEVHRGLDDVLTGFRGGRSANCAASAA